MTAGTIGRANLDGSGVKQDFITGAGFPSALAVDGTYIYWVNDGTIGRANLDGSGVNQNFIRGTGVPVALAVSGAYIYWTDAYTYSIGRANLDGSGVNEHFIPTGPNSTVLALAVNGAGVFWLDWANLEIGYASLNGSPVRLNYIRGGFCDPHGLAADSTHLYWSDFNYADYCYGQGAIARTDGFGATPPRKVLFLASAPMGLAVDGAHLYWSSGGSIGRANLDGSDVRANFITGAYSSGAVAVDAGGPPPAPQLTRVSQSRRKWPLGSALPRIVRTKPPIGTTFDFTLDRPARVWFLFTRTVVGRRVGGECVAQTNANRGRARCLRTVRAAFSRQAHAGRTRLRFQGRITRKRKLPPGRYTLAITATANGRHSKPAILRFTILP